MSYATENSKNTTKMALFIYEAFKPTNTANLFKKIHMIWGQRIDVILLQTAATAAITAGCTCCLPPV